MDVVRYFHHHLQNIIKIIKKSIYTNGFYEWGPAHIAARDRAVSKH
jgi:hypothetical protein